MKRTKVNPEIEVEDHEDYVIINLHNSQQKITLSADEFFDLYDKMDDIIDDEEEICESQSERWYYLIRSIILIVIGMAIGNLLFKLFLWVNFYI